VLDFAVALIFVFYLNRWIHRTPRKGDTPLTAPDQLSEPGPENNALKAEPESGEVFYNLVGDQLGPEDDGPSRR
jgi:hypothetical protein